MEAISANKSGARFVRQNLFRYDFLNTLNHLLQNFDMTWQGLLRNKLCHLIKLDYIYIYVLISTAVYENTTMEQCVSL